MQILTAARTQKVHTQTDVVHAAGGPPLRLRRQTCEYNLLLLAFVDSVSDLLCVLLFSKAIQVGPLSQAIRAAKI